MGYIVSEPNRVNPYEILIGYFSRMGFCWATPGVTDMSYLICRSQQTRVGRTREIL